MLVSTTASESPTTAYLTRSRDNLILKSPLDRVESAMERSEGSEVAGARRRTVSTMMHHQLVAGSDAGSNHHFRAFNRRVLDTLVG